MKKIPVTLLTGFLGAGKTTLLNSILKQYPDLNIRIIENEFGNENIDGQLIESSEAIREISNGCICCSSSEEFTSSLFDFLQGSSLPDHLIIETTGIANPEVLIRQFVCDYRLSQVFELNAVVTLADTLHLDGLIHQRPEVEPQLRCANVIVLSKTDLADAYQLDTAEQICRRINPEALIVRRCLDASETVDWLNLNSFSGAAISTYSLNSWENRSNKSFFHGSLKKIALSSSTPLDFLKFDTWIKSILRYPDFKIYRLKGFLYFEELPDRIILQAVQEIYQTFSGGKWKNDDEKKTILVIIGEGIGEEKLQSTFDLCLQSDVFIDYSDFCERLEILLKES